MVIGKNETDTTNIVKGIKKRAIKPSLSDFSIYRNILILLRYQFCIHSDIQSDQKEGVLSRET